MAEQEPVAELERPNVAQSLQIIFLGVADEIESQLDTSDIEVEDNTHHKNIFIRRLRKTLPEFREEINKEKKDIIMKKRMGGESADAESALKEVLEKRRRLKRDQILISAYEAQECMPLFLERLGIAFDYSKIQDQADPAHGMCHKDKQVFADLQAEGVTAEVNTRYDILMEELSQHVVFSFDDQFYSALVNGPELPIKLERQVSGRERT